MSNITNLPLIDWFETTLSQEWDGSTGTINVNETPWFTFPAWVKTSIVVNADNSKIQLAEISAYDAWAKTMTVSNITLEKWAGVNYSAQTHSIGSKVRISNNYEFWKAVTTAISSKLDSDADRTWSAGVDYAGMAGKPLTETQRDALTPVNGMIILNSTSGVLNQYISGAWTSFATGTTANASETVAGKVEMATDAQITAGTATGETGAELVGTPVQSKKSISLKNSVSSLSSTDELVVNIGWEDKRITVVNATKYSIVSASLRLWSYFWPWADWDITIWSNTTLTRDMHYNDLTISSSFTLSTAWFKIHVKWTLTNNGTIARNGNNGSGTTWGAALAAWTLPASQAWATGWAGWSSVWVWGAWASVNPSYVNMTGAAGWAGWSGWSWAWGAGWVWGAATRWELYNKVNTFEEILVNFIYPASQSTSSNAFNTNFFASAKYLWTAWGGGGWGWGHTGSGGAPWWWAWGNGGVVRICARTFNNAGTISSTWGNWANGGTSPWWAGEWGWGWWAWGSGGVLVLIYETLTNLWSVTLTWGTGWSWSTSPSWWTWGNGVVWVTWTTVQIQIT